MSNLPIWKDRFGGLYLKLKYMKKILSLLILLFFAHQIQAQQDTTKAPIKTDTIPQIQDTIRIDTVKIDTVKIIGIDSFTVKTGVKTVKGIASFYSKNLDGTKTATGEIFRNSKLTAASNSFKLNTWVRVTNLRNDKSVIVRINDRMHPRMAKKGRVVDLSRAAAKQLDFLKKGLTKVKIEAVDKNNVD